MTTQSYGPIQIDLSRDDLLTEQGALLLRSYYMKDDEDSPQESFARASLAYCQGDFEFAQRIYDYVSKLWFMFASPVLSNAPKGSFLNGEWVLEEWKNLPISCFLMQAPDTIIGQMDAVKELASLSVLGGGVGVHNQIRAISDKAPGPIPFEKVLDSSIGYFRQGKVRRGACAYYMDISHPDIVEHIKFRVPNGGDSARKADNRKSYHTAVNITKKFVDAVIAGDTWDLTCPHVGDVRETVKARDLWHLVLETRALRGEPYIHFIDVSNEHLPQTLKDKGLRIKGSNLCSEIFLPTSEDRTAVCCLSSLNLELFDSWKDTNMVQDLIRLLDNVLDAFIAQAPDTISKARFSAQQERSLGLGAMGFHGYLMKCGIGWETGGFNSAVQKNHQMFSFIKSEALLATKQLALDKGEAPDMVGTGRRNAHLLALAPNSNSSIVCNCTAACEPIASNAFIHRTRAGAHLVRNKYLQEVLEAKGLNAVDLAKVWNDIEHQDGSVQKIDILTDEEKAIFMTAMEIDQHWVVQHAEDRQEYICQGQSVNLFFRSMASASYVNSVHLKAAKGGKLKALYYYRTENKVKADIVKDVERRALTDWIEQDDDDDQVGCISCEG
jgi:ribonucleoside-diphosphate reductase alpha chain